MIENDKQKIDLLKQDLVKYSKQMGIVGCEVPELVFYDSELKEKTKQTYENFGKCLHRVEYLPDQKNLAYRLCSLIWNEY